MVVNYHVKSAKQQGKVTVAGKRLGASSTVSCVLLGCSCALHRFCRSLQTAAAKARLHHGRLSPLLSCGVLQATARDGNEEGNQEPATTAAAMSSKAKRQARNKAHSASKDQDNSIDYQAHTCSVTVTLPLHSPKLLMLEVVEHVAATTMVRITDHIDKVRQGTRCRAVVHVVGALMAAAQPWRVSCAGHEVATGLLLGCSALAVGEQHACGGV